MTQQTQQSPFKSIKDRIKANKEKGISIQGPDVMDYLYPASKVGIEVITPTGQLRSLPAVLIGADKARIIYFSLPATTPADAALYCQPGYRLTAAIICERGVGAMLCFEGFIEQFNKQPQLFTMRQPESMTLFKIRKEIRYPISAQESLFLPSIRSTFIWSTFRWQVAPSAPTIRRRPFPSTTRLSCVSMPLAPTGCPTS